MYEELNLRDENLIPTSHAKIRSYVCQQKLDAMQIKASLHRLQAIAEEQDVANLVLLLKELIPDYNPCSQLLKTAMSTKTSHEVRAKVAVLTVQAEIPAGTKLTQATLVN